jgi:WD40 repeat protein
MLAVGTQSGRLYLVDAGAGTVRLDLLAHKNGRVLGVALSPDGSRVATAGSDGVWKLWGADGKRRMAVQGHGKNTTVTSIVFSPCGGSLVTTGQQDRVPKIWDAETGRAGLTLQAGNEAYKDCGPAWTLSFSADGKRLASGGALIQVPSASRT